MRYKIQLLPQGAIPQDINLGFHMTDEAAPSEPSTGCCADCQGWGVMVNGGTSTGDVHQMPDGAGTFVISALGKLCEGQCITWALRSLVNPNGVDVDGEFAIAADGCTGATITAAGGTTYADLMIGAFATIDGQPYCEPVLLFGGCTVVPGNVSTQFGTDIALDGGAAPSSSGIPIDLQITLGSYCGCAAEGSEITWDLVQSAGVVGNGESLVQISPFDWQLQFSTLNDLTDAVFVATPTICGIGHPEMAVTFTCTNN